MPFAPVTSDVGGRFWGQPSARVVTRPPGSAASPRFRPASRPPLLTELPVPAVPEAARRGEARRGAARSGPGRVGRAAPRPPARHGPEHAVLALPPPRHRRVRREQVRGGAGRGGGGGRARPRPRGGGAAAAISFLPAGERVGGRALSSPLLSSSAGRAGARPHPPKGKGRPGTRPRNADSFLVNLKPPPPRWAGPPPLAAPRPGQAGTGGKSAGV